MSITCNSVKHSSLYVNNVDNVFTLTVPLHVDCVCVIDGCRKVRLHFEFARGFSCDGLSVPKIFRWFLKKWDFENELYNVAGMVHDALYGNKGFCVFDRDECDAIFRGILRESGCNRLHASTADFAVGLCAKSHWGDDALKCRHLVTMGIRDISEEF